LTVESTYEPEPVPEVAEPESDAPAFIVLESADDAGACTVDGECA
jgi:hypothetical protein